MSKSIDLPLHLGRPAQGIGGELLPEYAVAVRGIVEVGDGLMERLGGEIRQHPLKAAEGEGALIEVLRALGDLQADAVLHIVVDAPGFARLIPDPVPAVPGRDQVKGLPWIAAAGGQEAGHRGHVAHQGGDVVERGAAEALQDIAPAAVGGHEIGLVDVSLAEALTGQRAALNGESIEYRFHGILLSKHLGDAADDLPVDQGKPILRRVEAPAVEDGPVILHRTVKDGAVGGHMDLIGARFGDDPRRVF